MDVGKKLKHAPKIFFVNWFRSGDDGKFMWPGFGDNIRVLKWIAERTEGKARAENTAIGHVPHADDLDLSGLKLGKEAMKKLFEVNLKEWGNEISDINAFYFRFGKHLPEELKKEYEKLEEQVKKA
jgi:phosphoenolpyruvate carboxykinase (GTP)